MSTFLAVRRMVPGINRKTVRLRSLKWAVSLDGDTALIEDYSNPAVFVRAKDGTWTEDTSFMVSWWETDIDNHAVSSVSLSGNTALIGCGGYADCAEAYVFVRAEDGTWSHQATLAAEQGYEFGASVAVSGNIALIGSWDNATEGSFMFLTVRKMVYGAMKQNSFLLMRRHLQNMGALIATRDLAVLCLCTEIPL